MTKTPGDEIKIDESIFRFVRPRAFISTSLRRKDEPFVELIEKLARKHGFQPYGTVGRHTAAPIPIVVKMTEELQNSDCSIIAATTRYLQFDVDDNEKKEIKGVTEMIQVEAALTHGQGKPVLAFVDNQTNVGSFIPQITQYLRIGSEEDTINQQDFIRSYFEGAKNVILANWKKNGIPKYIGYSLHLKQLRWKEAVVIGRQHESDELTRILINSHSHIGVVGIPLVGKSLLVGKIIKNNSDNFDTITHIELAGEMTFVRFLDSFKQTILSDEDTSTMSKEILKQSIISKLSEFHSNLILLENYEVILSDSFEQDMKEQVISFLKTLPEGTRVVITSTKDQIDLQNLEKYYLEGLNEEDGKNLFLEYLRDSMPTSLPPALISDIKTISKIVGGHPPSLRILSERYQDLESTEPIINALSGIDMIDHVKDVMEKLCSIFKNVFNSLDGDVKEIIPNLLIFDSPFTTDAALSIVKVKPNEVRKIYSLGFLRKFDLGAKQITTDILFYEFEPIMKKCLDAFIKPSFPDKNIQDFVEYYMDLIYKVGTYDEKAWRKLNSIILKRTVYSDKNDLKKMVEFVKDDKEKAFICNKIGSLLLSHGCNDESIFYLRKSLEINELERNRVKIANDYCWLGLAYQTQDPSLGRQYHFRAAEIAKSMGLHSRLVKDYCAIGVCYWMESDLENALKFLTDALAESKKHEPNVLELQEVYTNLGGVYFHKPNYLKTLGFFMASAVINESRLVDGRRPKTLMAGDYCNIGACLGKLGITDEAISYHNRAIDIHNEFSDLYGLISDYDNLSSLYKQIGDIDKYNFFKQKAITLRASMNPNVVVAGSTPA